VDQQRTLVRLCRIFTNTYRYLRLSVKMEKRKGVELSTEELNGLMKGWAKDVLSLAALDIKVLGHQPSEKPVILVGNHISYMDIPLMMSITPTVFLSKSEVGNWPLIGRAAKRIGTLLVKRGSANSRVRALRTIQKYLEDPKRHLTIFPSGTTSMTEDTEWRWGIFQMASQMNVAVQPFRLRYHPMRTVAYIEKDTLVSHLWNLLKQEKVHAYVEFGEPKMITDPIEDSKKMREWTREPLLAQTDRQVSKPLENEDEIYTTA